MELSNEDRLALHEIPGRYGDSIDDRDWDRLRTIFTEDGVFDLTGVGSRVCTGIDVIVDFMENEAAHPRTHMMTNVWADATDDGAELRFRIVALIGGGKANAQAAGVTASSATVTGRQFDRAPIQITPLGARQPRRARPAVLRRGAFLRLPPLPRGGGGGTLVTGRQSSGGVSPVISNRKREGWQA